MVGVLPHYEHSAQTFSRKKFERSIMMENMTLTVHFFGGLSVSSGETHISHDSARSRQAWLILAYLLHNRKRIVYANELIKILNLEEKVNPSGALKTAIHRARAMLNQLDDGLGHIVLQYRNNGYCCSSDINYDIDTEHLESALNGENKDDCNFLLNALELYAGGFCSVFSSENWVIPLNVYYQNLYTRGVQIAVQFLENEKRYEECANLCQQALQRDPYRELFCQLLMRSLLALGRREQVISVYENMSKLMISAVGVMPDQESRALYREALKTVNLPKIPMDKLLDQLKEDTPIRGALFCDFDFFRNVYQSQARILLRSGEDVHIALFDIVSKGGEISERSLETIMNNLELHLSCSLRKGDMVTRCSASQFAVMLLHADYNNSNNVCRRITTSFQKKYPYIPAKIEWVIHSVDLAEGPPVSET